MLRQSFNDFKFYAELLKKEEGIDYTTQGADIITVMADRYCEALDTNNARKKNLYIAGLMLRFWHNIHKLEAKSPNLGLSAYDFMLWVYEAIEYACKYRVWQDPTKNINAQQAINRCISTIRSQHYYEYNLDKHKVNYIGKASLDAPVDEEGKQTLESVLVDENPNNDFQSEIIVRDLIQRYIDNKQIVEAIILDTIAFNDVQKQTKKVEKFKDAEGVTHKKTNYYSEFWAFRCVQILSKLPENYPEVFARKYKFNPVEFSAAFKSIQSAPNQKLYKFLSKTLTGAKKFFTA